MASPSSKTSFLTSETTPTANRQLSPRALSLIQPGSHNFPAHSAHPTILKNNAVTPLRSVLDGLDSLNNLLVSTLDAIASQAVPSYI